MVSLPLPKSGACQHQLRSCLVAVSPSWKCRRSLCQKTKPARKDGAVFDVGKAPPKHGPRDSASLQWLAKVAADTPTKALPNPTPLHKTLWWAMIGCCKPYSTSHSERQRQPTKNSQKAVCRSNFPPLKKSRLNNRETATPQPPATIEVLRRLIAKPQSWLFPALRCKSLKFGHWAVILAIESVWFWRWWEAAGSCVWDVVGDVKGGGEGGHCWIEVVMRI